MPTAKPIASLNPFRNTADSSASSSSVSADRMVEQSRHERVADDVRGGVGRRERDGDHEVGGGEPEQAEHEGLAAPARQQLLEHRDAALAVGAVLGDAPVDRQRAEERQQDEDERGDGREGAGGDERDARLVAERREVVDAREAHDLPPRGLVHVLGVRALGLAKALEEPAIEPAAVAG